jgi:hypothetical protein
VLDAFQHHVLNIPEGIGQAAAHGVNALVQGVAGGSDYAKGVQSRLDAQDAAARKREADYQARTAGNAGSYVGAALGEVAPWMVGISELRAMGLLPKVAKGEGILGKSAELAKKGGLLAAEGGVMGLVQPVTGEGSYGRQKAAQVAMGAAAAPLLGAATDVAITGAKAAAGATRYLTPSGRETLAGSRLAKLLDNAGVTPEQLRNGSSIPGYTRTVAQAAPSARTVSLERSFRNDKNGAGELFAQQDAANNAVLRAQVAQLAGTDAEMAEAQQALRNGPARFWSDNLAAGNAEGRFDRAGQHLREAANAKPLPMPEFKMLDEARRIMGQVHRGSKDALTGENELAALAPKSAYGKRALTQAQGILNQGMVDPSRIIGSLQKLALSGNPTISSAAEKQLAVIAKNQVDSTGWVHAGVLDDLRQNVSKVITDQFGKVDKVAAAKFAPIQGQIVRTVERAIPGYRDSLAAYRAAKQPINDMEAGRQLLGAIDSGGRDVASNQAVRLSDLKSLLGKDARRQFPMSPQARTRLATIMDELQQRSISDNKISASGSNTAADMSDAMRGKLLRLLFSGGATALGGAVGHLPGAAIGAGLAEGAQLLGRDVNTRMGAMATNAPAAESYLRAYLLSQQRPILASPFSLLPYQQ